MKEFSIENKLIKSLLSKWLQIEIFACVGASMQEVNVKNSQTSYDSFRV